MERLDQSRKNLVFLKEELGRRVSDFKEIKSREFVDIVSFKESKDIAFEVLLKYKKCLEQYEMDLSLFKRDNPEEFLKHISKIKG